jgi:hypothetical protein
MKEPVFGFTNHTKRLTVCGPFTGSMDGTKGPLLGLVLPGVTSNGRQTTSEIVVSIQR